MKAIKFLTLLSATILVLSNCFGNGSNLATNQLGGVENAGIIAHPVSVKAWRTIGSLKIRMPSSEDPANFYEKSGEAILVSTNLVTQLNKVLLNEQSYLNSSWGKDCFPEPGVVITFSNGKKGVNIFFCFECAILIVENERDGKETVTGLQADFDPSRPELIKIMKNIFPKDSQIQSLAEQRN